jgi:uncharacterized LabA/DUF88 family protein
MQSKVAVYIDSSNLFYTQSNFLNWWLDPGKLLKYIGKWGDVIEASYYMSLFDGSSPGKDKFRRFLSYVGYSVIARPVKHIQQEDGTIKDKCDLDIKIATDMLMAVDLYDIAVLVSGDGDFCCVLEALKARGKEFRVLSTDRIIARELRELAGMNYIDLENIRSDVERDDKEEDNGLE